MRIAPKCEKCLYDRQVAFAQKNIEEESAREAYLEEIRRILLGREEMDPSPYIVSLFHEVQRKYIGDLPVFPNEKYNKLMLGFQDRIEERINAAQDPLRTALIYARVGNYIDFGAMNDVDDNMLVSLIEDAERSGIDDTTYAGFVAECERAKRFLLLCDNCGEIVFDKLLVRCMKKRFPELEMYVMVRGGDVLNDVTMKDAEFTGMSAEAHVISSGRPISGTVYDKLSEEARVIFDAADVILAKGQGNYEGLRETVRPIYYCFLCKCDLFIERFEVPKYTGMFIKE